MLSTSTQFYKAPRYLLRKLNILQLLKKHDDIKTFLDVGCGAGELACTLAERGIKGVAVDFSKDAIKVATGLRKKRNIPKTNLQFKLGGFENISNEKYDLVSCLEVLEHIKDDKEFLSRLVSHSKKYVLISVPAKQKLYDSSDESVGHFRRYSKPDLIKLLNDVNLNIVSFANYGFPFTDILRLTRKQLFNKRLTINKSQSMDNRSKDSGINPIKIPKKLAKIDIEKIIVPLYITSRIFNNYDLSDSYLVLCEKSN